MKWILLTVLIFGLQAFGDENGSWFCEQTSSSENGNIMRVCGMADGLDEGAARTAALADAIHQFKMLCEISSDCRGKQINVEPRRTSCKPSHKKEPTLTGENQEYITCARMIVITIEK
jgi:hypothetical protein